MEVANDPWICTIIREVGSAQHRNTHAIWRPPDRTAATTSDAGGTYAAEARWAGFRPGWLQRGRLNSGVESFVSIPLVRLHLAIAKVEECLPADEAAGRSCAAAQVDRVGAALPVRARRSFRRMSLPLLPARFARYEGRIML